MGYFHSLNYCQIFYPGSPVSSASSLASTQAASTEEKKLLEALNRIICPVSQHSLQQALYLSLLAALLLVQGLILLSDSL